MDDNVALSLRQFTEAWRLMCAGPGSVIESAGGITYIFSRCPISFFNVAILDAPAMSAGDLQARARDACAWTSDKHVPWLLVLTHECVHPGIDAAATVEASELVPIMTMTGMLAQDVTPPAVPSDLQLIVPRDDDECAAILDINGLAYGMDLTASRYLLGHRSFWSNHVSVLGLVDGQPASCAAVLMVDGYRYVALVATAPDKRRRGFADTAMRRALELAGHIHGARPTVLHATEAGRPIYERMGYVPISTHTVFMNKSFLDGH